MRFRPFAAGVPAGHVESEECDRHRPDGEGEVSDARPFRTKAGLLQAAYEWAVTADGSPPHLSEWWQAVETAADAREAVGHLVAGTVPILQRAAPLVWVVRSDQDARAAYERNEQLRRAGNERLVELLSVKHQLRTGLSPRPACDILLALTGPEQFRLLTAESGWTSEEYAEWVTGAVLRELFALES